ncbi:MAG: MBL fold metallo-hydrolase [Nitriliruptorales bacterium]|nr:MBL fold metallo-hydrolase [Nitriliruptorales bacterium]
MARRRFLVDLGRLTVGAVVLGPLAAACDDGEEGAVLPEGTPPGEGETITPTTTDGDRVAEDGWGRVDLGFVSAYVVVRAGQAVVIDTGVEGNEGEVERVLSEMGLGWPDVSHVILTHKHPDHVGSLPAVLEAAADAEAYAGEADIPAIEAPRPVGAVGDGDTVIDLEIVATPGHTPGHISVIDPGTSTLFAGDALNGDSGRVVGPNPQFTEDMDQAWRSVTKLGGLTYDTVVFGHGEPVAGDASSQVAALQRS